MAKKASTKLKTAPVDALPDPAEPDDDADVGADDAMIMVPLPLVSSPAGENAGSDQADEIVVTATPQRRAVGEAVSALMGDAMDADGVGADLIDAGAELVIWGVSPSPDAVAVMPDLDDWTDPEAWLDALSDMDLPADIEMAIERLARAAQIGVDAQGEETARRTFARRLGELLRNAGIEALAVRRTDGFDWIALNAEDFARERDGEPWAPPGGVEDGFEPRPVGISLGLGGRVSLWPAGAERQAEAPDPASAAEPAAPERAQPERERVDYIS